MSNNPNNLDLIQSNQAQKEVAANALFGAASPAMIYGRREQASSGLTWGYYGGYLRTGSGFINVPNSTVALTDGAINYVQASLETGAVSANTTGFSSGSLALYQVTVASGVATAWSDYRQALLTQLGGGGTEAFTTLSDTPDDYTDAAGKFVAVNPGATGLEFVDAPTGVEEFTELTDAPSSYSGQALKVVRVKSTEDGLEFATDAGGVTEFTQLDDVPDSFVGQANKMLVVNPLESALTFVDAPSFDGDFTDLVDVPSSYTGQAGKLVAVNPTATGLQFVDPSEGGVTEFVQLDDVPSTYVGQAGKIPSVKATEDGLEFIDAPAGTDEFTELADAPSSYTGQAGKLVAVNPTATGLQFVDPSEGGVSEFVQLEDVPSTYVGQAGKTVRVKSTEDGLEFTTGGGGGAAEFTELGDVPNSYVGQGSKLVAVKPDATGLQFVDAPTGGEDNSLYATRSAATSGLTWGYHGGAFTTYSSNNIMVADGTVTLADDAVNYVQLQRSNGNLSLGASGFEKGARLPIAQITTAAGEITEIIDWRQKMSNVTAFNLALQNDFEYETGRLNCSDVYEYKEFNQNKIMYLDDFGNFIFKWAPWGVYDIFSTENMGNYYEEPAVILKGGAIKNAFGVVSNISDIRIAFPVTTTVEEYYLYRYYNGGVDYVSTSGSLPSTPGKSIYRITVDNNGNITNVVDMRVAEIQPNTDQVSSVFDGGGAVLTVGKYVDVVMPYTCTAQSMFGYADVNGVVEIDISKSTFDNYPYFDAVGTFEINTADKNRDTTLSGWSTKMLYKGEIVRLKVTTATSITKLTLSIQVEK